MAHNYIPKNLSDGNRFCAALCNDLLCEGNDHKKKKKCERGD